MKLRSPLTRRLAGVAAVAATTLAAATTLTAPTAAQAADVRVAWAPAASAAITPGVQTNTDGSGQCTANFVFTDAAANVYIGQAAHCAGTGERDRDRRL